MSKFQSFNNSKSRFNNNNNNNNNNNTKQTQLYKTKDDNQIIKKSPEEWTEGTFTWTNNSDGKMKWKEIGMKEVKLGKDKIRVNFPDAWKFQIIEPCSYISRDGSKFMFESAYLQHEKILKN
jgi:hypothetical protein